MANIPTDDGYLDIANLLDTEEQKAKEKIAQQKAGASSNGKNEDSHMGGTSPNGMRPPSPISADPRRLDRSDPRERPVREQFDPLNPLHRDKYLKDREDNEQRRNRRSRGATDDDSDKASANGSVRSRRRSRSPRADGRRSHRSRDRTGGDYYRGGGRSSDDYYRPNGDRQARSRSPGRRGGRDDRGRRDDRSRRDARDGDRRGDRRQRSPAGGGKRKTPEPTDDERDRRTVFVQQLAARLRSRELKEFFEQVGGVVDAQIVKDRVSGRSKG